MIPIVIFLVAIAWTGFSIYWFISNLGNKNKKDKWYEKLFYPPVFLIAYLLSFITYITEKVKKND